MRKRLCGPSSHSVYSAQVSTYSHMLNITKGVSRQRERRKQRERRAAWWEPKPRKASENRTSSEIPEENCGVQSAVHRPGLQPPRLPHWAGQQLSVPAWESPSEIPDTQKAGLRFTGEGTYPPSQAESNPRAHDMDSPSKYTARLTGAGTVGTLN